MGYGYFGAFLIDTIKKKELLKFEQSTLFYWNHPNPNGVPAANQLGMFSGLKFEPSYQQKFSGSQATPCKTGFELQGSRIISM